MGTLSIMKNLLDVIISRSASYPPPKTCKSLMDALKRQEPTLTLQHDTCELENMSRRFIGTGDRGAKGQVIVCDVGNMAY